MIAEWFAILLAYSIKMKVIIAIVLLCYLRWKEREKERQWEAEGERDWKSRWGWEGKTELNLSYSEVRAVE